MRSLRGRRRKNGDVEAVRSQVQSQASQAVIIQRRCSGALSDSKVSGNLPLQLPLLKQKAAVLHIWKNNSDSASSYLIPFGFYVFLLSWGGGGAIVFLLGKQHHLAASNSSSMSPSAAPR